MSIENELSSDIALALLASEGKDPEQLKHVKDLILRIHATLQEKAGDAEQTLKRARAAGADGNDQSGLKPRTN